MLIITIMNCRFVTLKYDPLPGAKLPGGYRGLQHPSMIEIGILSGYFFGSSYIGRAVLENFIYVALLLLLFAPSKYYVVCGDEQK